ncbi:hypothetical protein TGAMA5MH_05521 [Trichoderma gamsii]|uniref:ELMO domain-containing protein n=1 Tax=Trichoderma gamsii TaxID=398673 RepID=A0A2K0TB71_9HYPO|nr:hypothetical protein TGAMA5MH_05521 [Trichoderma gamsii]
MDQADIPALLSRLASDEDAARKMAVFKLQSSINDPAFADVFISSGGLVILRRLIMTSGGNTLAYALQSLSRLLEVDMGWDIFEGPTASELVERIVELIVTNPLVNILRGAMSILVALVGHSQSSGAESPIQDQAFGFRALKPAVAIYPQFFDLVVQQLNSADHALCANALMLVNALIRDALSTKSVMAGGNGKSAGDEWPKLMKRLQDLGLIKAVYKLMQGTGLQDLAHPALEFQNLSKVIQRKWRDVKVDLERPEHRRSLKSLHLSSAPDRPTTNGHTRDNSTDTTATKKDGRKHSPEKWRRLGFETESPAQDFDVAGYLGMLDMTDYVRKNEDRFQKLLLEQATKPMNERCPVARASLAMTMILYEHFDVDKADLEDAKGYHQGVDTKDYDRVFQPLLLQWPRLHAAGLHSFFRIWKATGAVQEDFDKVAELVRILIEKVAGQAPRTRDILEIEDDLQEYDMTRLRELQMELLEMSFEETWGKHLYQVRDVLKQEALQFVKEQRIRCLLEGAWFQKKEDAAEKKPWRFARLSHNRRYLHYTDFEKQMAQDPGLNTLMEKIDLSTISSVVSNVSATNDDSKTTASGATIQNITSTAEKAKTKITIYSFVNPADVSAGGGGGGEAKEQAVLSLWPTSHSIASEWLDGLLLLLGQAPVTTETSKLVNLVGGYGLKIRLLNVRMDAVEGPPPGAGIVPSREGLDEDYFYEV